MEEQQDYLFPFLQDSDYQTTDWFAIRTRKHYEQVVESMHWLSSQKVGKWLVYIVMQDFIDVSIIQHLHQAKLPFNKIQIKLAAFFFNEPKIRVKTIQIPD